MNIGEELVADYLQFIKKCEFVQKNLYTEDVQGEIDVVGINLKTKTVYFCEVAIHLVTGLQYTKNNQPNNESKLYEKFLKDIDYARTYFKGYKHHFMFWSPIVKDKSDKAKYNQLNDVRKVQQKIKQEKGVDIEVIVNGDFLAKLRELKEYASIETKDIKSAVIRLYQIEEKTKKYIESPTYKNKRKIEIAN